MFYWACGIDFQQVKFEEKFWLKKQLHQLPTTWEWLDLKFKKKKNSKKIVWKDRDKNLKIYSE